MAVGGPGGPDHSLPDVCPLVVGLGNSQGLAGGSRTPIVTGHSSSVSASVSTFPPSYKDT